MKNIPAIILLIIAFSCKTEKQTSTDNIQKNKEVKTIDLKIDKTLLNGVWAENENENAIFQIEGDTLRYVEFYDTPYFYELEGDSIKIHIEKDYVSKNKILKINKDSLILKSDEDEIIKLYKRKEF